jgi:hypothetical protein
MARLSSYVSSSRRRRSQSADLDGQLKILLTELCGTPELEILNRLGRLNMFPSRLQNGIRVRDAWLNVLDHEPAQGALCADDSNPYTRIPLLLARERGLPSIACQHGALDARYLFKRSYGSVIWAKGDMEQDFLVRKCKVPAGRVEICAPALATPSNPHKIPPINGHRPYIVFFSEPYEVSGGRGEGFYRDTLPDLAGLALATGRKLVVKLHPAESKRERERALRRTISEEHSGAVQLISGPLTEELLSNTWFAVTVQSTVSMECAVRGIPCFLCKWLEPGGYEYVEQFIRFGAGIGLDSPEEIAAIREYMQNEPLKKLPTEQLWQTADKGRLNALLMTKVLA